MTPEMIRQLPGGCALVVRGGLSPVIARLPMAWHDPAYKRARRTGHAIAALTPVPPAAAVPAVDPVPPTIARPGPHRPAPRPPAITGTSDGNGQQWPWQ
jgi:hypothetical protein